MHVLPLPFGLAVALMPRREAKKLRDDKPVRPSYEKTIHARDAIQGDIQYFNAGRFIL
jgi:hypothetical protein